VVSDQLSEKTGAKTMSGRIFVWLLTTVLLTAAPNVDAEQAGKVARIGYLDPSTESAAADFLDGVRKDLSKLGWIEKKNIAIEYRFAEQNVDRLSELAAELVNQKVDLIVVGTGPAPVAAKKATSTIPIVMRSSVDPVGAGLVASLARPGGNITGFSGLSPELNTKRLEILKDAIPRLSRVGYLLTSAASISVTGELLLKETRSGLWL
jgi:putative tryptophan/tyrosine transport system substrate-binding protein